MDLATKQIKVIANLGQGIIDGVHTDDAGNLLVSHNEGRLYPISPDGKVAKLLDLTVQGHNIADFDFVPAGNLVVFPTFFDNRVMAYRLLAGAM
jgi:hypothetical protein